MYSETEVVPSDLKKCRTTDLRFSRIKFFNSEAYVLEKMNKVQTIIE